MSSRFVEYLYGVTESALKGQIIRGLRDRNVFVDLLTRLVGVVVYCGGGRMGQARDHHVATEPHNG